MKLGIVLFLPLHCSCFSMKVRRGRSTPVEAVVGVWNSSSISMAADSAAFDDASNIIQALSYLPAPISPVNANPVDPRVTTASSCDRDYGMLCPEQFVNIGPVDLGKQQHCVADSSYTGPCQSDAYTFSGMTLSAMVRWSEMCQANWPCKRCERNYQAPCPEGWMHLEGRCSPPSEYSGPCQDNVVFESYNVEMLEQWSSECGAFWSCMEGDADLPGVVPSSSLLEQGEKNANEVGFLASKTIPVDAYKIRNSLYLTQPMRSPAQVAVNVIMREHLPKMEQESKYRGIEDQVDRLRQQVADLLRSMAEDK